MGQEGWISLHRKIQNCWFWDDKPYDRARAWIDLLLLAVHSDTKQAVEGDFVEIHRGQYLTSIRRLADRWGWSKDKVSKFLSVLERDGMIEKTIVKKRTLLTIENYGFYQSQQDNNRTVNGQSSDSERTQNNNVNNVNNILDSKESNCPKHSQNDFQQAIEAWNSLEVFGIKPVSRMASDSQRYKMLGARLKQYGLDAYMVAIENIRQSDFLQGKKGSKPFFITFDWFVKPNNFVKVLDGNYNHDNRNTVPEKESPGGDNEWQG